MFTLTDRKVSYLLVQNRVSSDKSRKNSVISVALFTCLLRRLYCRFNSYLLLLEAKLEE